MQVHQLFLISVLLFTAPAVYSGSHTDTIKLTESTAKNTLKNRYLLDILNAAMKETAGAYGSYRIEQTAPARRISRAIYALKNNKDINTHLGILHADLLDDLHVVPIPIYRGLMNYRLLLIHKSNSEEFGSISTVDDLKLYKTGMFGHSSTIKQLRKLSFPTIATHNTRTMFSMLEHRRFHYILRGIHEAYDELEGNQYDVPNVIIAPKLGVHLSQPVVLYMSPGETRLAKRLEEGLIKITHTGEFETIFNRHFLNYIKKSKFHTRKIIKIDSDLAGRVNFNKTPGLWYSPTDTSTP